MITPENYGATKADWSHFHNLGLTADLLPVVSNPNAVTGPKSELKGLGKTPSRYYESDAGAGLTVGGIPKWTETQATKKQVERWSMQPDYGICIQTRNVRAIDIDVDTPHANAIRAFIADFLMVDLPCRYRMDSAKILLAFRMEGQHDKSVIRVADGMIEFLMNGQQFIAAGTHPKGERYAWENGLPAFIPTIPIETFQALQRELDATFGEGVGIVQSLRKRAPRRGEDDGVELVADPVADFIMTNWEVYEEGVDGELFIPCPWKTGHSSDSGPSETAYFRAGTRGYAVGHFKCMHAHCEVRTDNDFLDAIGYTLNGLYAVLDNSDLVGTDPNFMPGTVQNKRPPYERDQRGRIFASVSNISMALDDPTEIGFRICYDEFRGEPMIAPVDQPSAWQEFRDTDYARLALILERRRDFLPISDALLRRFVALVADNNRFDSAIEWLENVVPAWDGKERINDFFATHFGVESSPYTRAVGEYFFTALAARTLNPGSQVDMVPVLIGERQGEGKSSGIRLLVPGGFYTPISFSDSSETIARKIRATLLASIDELRGLYSRDMETIKTFITETEDVWIPKYKEHKTRYYRRCVFIATTNEIEFLADNTGNRRWLPLEVTGTVDRAAIACDMDQLWAEARDRYKLVGVAYAEAERLAREVHGKHMVTDVWQANITTWLDMPDEMAEGRETPRQRNFVTIEEILTKCLGFMPHQIKRPEQQRVAGLLQRMGWQSWSTRRNRLAVRGWRDPKVKTALDL